MSGVCCELKHFSVNCIVWDSVFSFRRKGCTFIGTALSLMLKINFIQMSCMYVHYNIVVLRNDVIICGKYQAISHPSPQFPLTVPDPLK